jgi:hypothetical protein
MLDAHSQRLGNSSSFRTRRAVMGYVCIIFLDLPREATFAINAKVGEHADCVAATKEDEHSALKCRKYFRIVVSKTRGFMRLRSKASHN